MQIEHQRQQKHRRRLVPKRVLALAALRRGVLKKVRHQTLNVVVVTKIYKRVVAMALLHVDEVDHLNVIAFCFQEPARVPEKLALWVEAYETAVGVHDVGFCKKPRLASTGAAADQDVQVAAVLSSVEADGDILRQNLVCGPVPAGILLVDRARRAPFRRAVFLTPPIVSVVGEINADPYGIAHKKYEDSF